MNTEGSTILIADCHIHAHSDAEGSFFEMLDKIASLAPARVIFLGDIFDLWVALDGYESFGHHQFVEWCRKNKNDFEIGFIEGNHEFFVKDSYTDAFTWITDRDHNAGSMRFMHGDLINKTDWQYKLLRLIIRNPITRFLLKITSGSIGPKIAEKARVIFRSKGPKQSHPLPMAQLKLLGEAAESEGVTNVFAGHFHTQNELVVCGKTHVIILPAWECAEEIMMLGSAGEYQSGSWKELLA